MVVEDNIQRGVIVSLFVITVGLKGGTLYNVAKSRWLAAEGLIRIGRKTIVPMLETLVKHSDSYWLREGIHHVLHDINRGKTIKLLRPILVVLEGPEPSLEVPTAARAALDILTKKV